MPERPYDEGLEQATNRWMMWGLALIALAVVAFPAYRLYEPGSREEAGQTLVDSQAQQGEHLFALNCAACHGADGLGGIGPALNSEQFLASADEQIRQLIVVGVPGSQMSAYSLDFGGPMTLEQIDSVAVYLRSLEDDAPDFPGWRDPQENEPVEFPTPPTVATTFAAPEPEPAETDPATGGLAAQGAEIFSTSCGGCHGSDLQGGVGPALGAGSVIAGRADAAVQAVIEDGRGGMPAWGSVLSTEEIEALIAFLRSEQG